jgi:hypothetical protein
MLKTARCTHCGADLKLAQESKIIRCDYCKTDLIIDQAIAFSKVSIDYSKEISNLRKLQSDYTRSNDVRGLLSVSERILELVPGDYRSEYLLAYANQMSGNQSFMTSFLTANHQTPSSELLLVLNHLISNYDLRMFNKVRTYLEKHEPQSVTKLLQVHEERRDEEQKFVLAAVDVFICFSSKNQPIAERVLSELESEGLRCWISSRNLKPNDHSNYWNTIEAAIKRSKVLVVISSEDAMLSPDVIKEIDIANDNQKKLIEFKIDDSKHTSFFKYSFDGNQWINGANRVEQDYQSLINRVFYTLDILPKVIKKESDNVTPPNYYSKPKVDVGLIKRLSKKWWVWTLVGGVSVIVILFYIVFYVPYRPDADLLNNTRYEWEDNDSIELANRIREGDTYISSLSSYWDVDYYVYDERIFGRVRIVVGVVTDGATAADVVMYLLDENGIVVSEGGAVGDLVALQLTVTNSKRYYIYVTQSENSSYEGVIDYILYIGY